MKLYIFIISSIKNLYKILFYKKILTHVCLKIISLENILI